MGASGSHTRVPEGGSIAFDGTILDHEGNPVEPEPVPETPPKYDIHSKVPPGGTIGWDGTIYDADGRPAKAVEERVVFEDAGEGFSPTSLLSRLTNGMPCCGQRSQSGDASQQEMLASISR